ncbi:hypothetical protein INP57_12775 [Saccharopolyspora sp. HNM0986]|uniref:hypothetical protein n=1 Tax=Saccharopolyspora galaxeae TaxID=2781241 RepID=UPI00190ADBA1|nr:hypothetical protein [Saccharopolyspora sp. HNM0986]MBK0867687.1 hypothetical protein [Saccharopolyspora sp. HNM0986]
MALSVPVDDQRLVVVMESLGELDQGGRELFALVVRGSPGSDVEGGIVERPLSLAQQHG